MHANHRPIPAAAALLCVVAHASGAISAQEGPTRPLHPAHPLQDTPAATHRSPRLRYPDDADFIVARVHGEELTLGDVLGHVDERHSPGLLALVATPGGSLLLESPLLAHWVRQLADVRALELQARAAGHGRAAIEEAQAAALKEAFERWLETYVATTRRGGRQVELDQAKVDRLLARFQREFGLDSERRGLLDLLVPDDYTEAELYEFYTSNIYALVGALDIQQIFVTNRDRQTGGLLEGPGRRLARAKINEIRARAADDGSNFAELARRYSEERVAAGRGGLMTGVGRFDERLPAALCRAAWKLPDGGISDPVETSYGLHIVRRIEYSNQSTLLYNDAAKRVVRETMRKMQQEDLLFATRRELEVELEY